MSTAPVDHLRTGKVSLIRGNNARVEGRISHEVQQRVVEMET